MDEPIRILIADDHPLVLGALRQALTGAISGAEIYEAADLDSLSAALEATPGMDLVLLDLSMPGVRGFSGLMYLRAQHAGGGCCSIGGTNCIGAGGAVAAIVGTSQR